MKVMKTNRRTNNISPASAERMLNFLNKMRRAEEIVEAVNTKCWCQEICSNFKCRDENLSLLLNTCPF